MATTDTEQMEHEQPRLPQPSLEFIERRRRRAQQALKPSSLRWVGILPPSSPSGTTTASPGSSIEDAGTECGGSGSESDGEGQFSRAVTTREHQQTPQLLVCAGSAIGKPEALPQPMLQMQLRNPERHSRPGSKDSRAKHICNASNISAAVSFNFTPAQHEALGLARRVYTEAGGLLDEYADIYLARFLHEHNWSVAAATRQLERTAVWRAHVGADTIRRRILSGELKFATGFGMVELLSSAVTLPCQGTTRDGDLLGLTDIGALDSTRLVRALHNEEAYFQANLHLLEYESVAMDRLSAASGSLVRLVQVCECKGFSTLSLHPRLLSWVSQTLPLQDHYYPSHTRASIFVNAPWAVRRVWRILQRFLSSEAQQKVTILGEPLDSQAALHELIEPAQLPSVLGGTKRSITPESVHELSLHAMGVGVEAQHSNQVSLARTWLGRRLNLAGYIGAS